MNFRVATPAGVICAKPSRWISVHEREDASQNATCPAVSEELPARTLALRLTAVPAGTAVTRIPPAEIERFIVVGVVPACAAVAEHRTIPVSHFSAADGLTLILSPSVRLYSPIKMLSLAASSGLIFRDGAFAVRGRRCHIILGWVHLK